MKYADIPTAQTVVLSCKARGIKHVVISPGSRNAPLTIGFTEHPFFNCFSIVDERSAAFFALGIALQQQAPVVLVCTSGSALLNYYPAIAEAFYSDIPLVIISADRPFYKIDIGDGQTIRQEQVYRNHIAFSTNLKLDVCHARKSLEKYALQLLAETQTVVEKHNQDEVLKALDIAWAQNAPVHINVPFEEPLYGTVAEPIVAMVPEREPMIEPPVVADMGELVAAWNQAERKMVLVGTLRPDAMAKAHVAALATDPSVLIFTETTSNLHHPNCFPSIDSIIFPIEKDERHEAIFKSLQPDILITMGGMVVSKKIKAFLRDHPPKSHWHIGSQKAYDTFFNLKGHIKTDLNSFFPAFLSQCPKVESDYHATWAKAKAAYEAKRTTYLDTIPFCDFGVFDRIFKTIPEGYQVHLSNSSTVRYAQLFDMHESLKVFCNRGTSGIDGSTSTAVGASMYEAAPTLLISGDLSFFYDSNAFWNDHLRNDLRVLVINNAGGGIFRILPGDKTATNFKTFFETTHELTAAPLCEQFGLGYERCSDHESLSKALQTFYQPSSHPKLLEIVTPRIENDAILLGYFDFLS